MGSPRKASAGCTLPPNVSGRVHRWDGVKDTTRRGGRIGRKLSVTTAATSCYPCAPDAVQRIAARSTSPRWDRWSARTTLFRRLKCRRLLGELLVEILRQAGRIGGELARLDERIR